MKLTIKQLTASAFIFEKANGNVHSNFENKLITASELSQYIPKDLEQIIIDGLNSGIYDTEKERISSYWALSKIGNPKLISHFKKWLKMELDNSHDIPIFQILVALDILEEPAFNDSRTGRGSTETELNIKDAKDYLNKNTAQ